MTNRTELKTNREILVPLDEATGKDGRRAAFLSLPAGIRPAEIEDVLQKAGICAVVLPEGFSKQPWAWQCGYWSGCWQPTEKDKEPPRNPITKGTVPYREWEEGFKAAREARRCTDS